MPADRMTDRLRIRATRDGDVVYSDVLMARYVDRIDLWGRAVDWPGKEPHPSRPEFVLVDSLPGASFDLGRKGVGTLTDGPKVYEVVTLRNCCSSPFRDLRP